MADGVALKSDASTTVATALTEEVTTLNGGAISAQHAQRAAIVLIPSDGTAVDVSSSNPLPVTVSSGSITVDSEFPTAAALADNTANPTTTLVGSMGMWYDGTTWDRARGDSTDGLLVNLGANNDVTVTGSVTANAGTNLNTSALALESGGNLAASATSLAIIDDWDESDRAKVNPIVGSAGVAGGSGVVGATTQRVVLATDVGLPAGTNNIGDVDIASIAAGDNNIGNVDIVTVPAPLSTAGGGTEATALRVTVATDSTGVLSVDDNGGSLTVDGTVSVSGAVDTELTTADLDTGAGTDTRAVVGLVYGASGGGVLVSTTNPLPIADNGGSLTVDYATTGSGTATGALRVELPTNGTGVIATVGAVTAITNALPAGTNAIGKLAANSGVDIGDVDITSIVPGTGATNLGKAEDAVHSTGDVGVMALAVRNDNGATTYGADQDYCPIAVNAKGAVLTEPYPIATATITTLASAATSAQLLASTAGRKGLMLTNTDANGVYVKYGTTASATSFTVYIPGGSEAAGFGYWEMPRPIYTGRIDAIWAADGSGSLIATELT